MSPFRFRVPVPVRFRDIDVGGHAHHSHALAYFEEARWAYWTRVTGAPLEPEAVDYILAEARVRYHARVLYPDTLTVGVRAVAIGRSRVDLDYEAVTGAGTVVLTGTTAIVMYDYQRGGARAVTDAVRRAIEAHEGQSLPRRRDPFS